VLGGRDATIEMQLLKKNKRRGRGKLLPPLAQPRMSFRARSDSISRGNLYAASRRCMTVGGEEKSQPQAQKAPCGCNEVLPFLEGRGKRLGKTDQSRQGLKKQRRGSGGGTSSKAGNVHAQLRPQRESRQSSGVESWRRICAC